MTLMLIVLVLGKKYICELTDVTWCESQQGGHQLTYLWMTLMPIALVVGEK